MAAGFSARGECIYFPNLKGIGRADYLFVEPTTSKAWVHYNVCPNGAGPIPALPEAPDGPITISGSMSPYLKGCTDQQKALIDEAWSEAATLAAAHYEWWPGSTWQDTMTDYLGSNTKNDLYVTLRSVKEVVNWVCLANCRNSAVLILMDTDPCIASRLLPCPVLTVLLAVLTNRAENVENQYGIHWNSWPLRRTISYAYFYCSEDDVPIKDDPSWSRKCTDKYGNNTDVTAYSWSDTGTFWQSQYVVFCPMFFTSELSSLASKVKLAQDIPHMPRIIDYWRPIRARTLFHETYHWEKTVSNPQTIDHTYDPRIIFELAYDTQVPPIPTPNLPLYVVLVLI